MVNKGIVFDFDGVIINTHDIQKKALEISYHKICGAGEPPYESFFKHSGDSLQNIFRKLGLPSEMISIYREVSRKSVAFVKVYSGIIEIIRSLKNLGYRCGLSTGKDRERTIEILDYLQLRTLFDTIVCSDDVSEPKPNPESLLKAMKDLNVEDVNHVIMVGDGINDILCAKSINARSIAVTWGDVEEKDIIPYKPDCIVSSMESLYDDITKYLG